MDGAFKKRKEHLQQRFMRHGIDGLMPRDAIELLLSYEATDGIVLHGIVDDLFTRFGDISGILNADPALLREVPGITDEMIDLIHFQPQLYAMISTVRIYDVSLSDVEQACAYFASQLRWQPVEQIMMVSLGRDLTALSCDFVGEGTGSQVPVNSMKIIKNANEVGSRVIILGHNHPSGSCVPSDSDILTTDALRTQLKAAGIELLDHIIVGVDGVYSMMRSEDSRIHPDYPAIEEAMKRSAKKRKNGSKTPWM